MATSIATLKKIVDCGEANYYLDAYTKSPPGRFAVIKINAECLQEQHSLDEIAIALNELQSIGILPSISLGLDYALVNKLAGVGNKPKMLNNDVIVDSGSIFLVENIAADYANILMRAISTKNGSAEVISPQDLVAIATRNEQAGYGTRNGNIAKINPDRLFSAIERKHIPIVYPICKSDSNGTLYVNSALFTAKLVKEVDPVKHIIVSADGCIRDLEGKIIDEIILGVNEPKLSNGYKLDAESLSLYQEAVLALNSRPGNYGQSVQIVGPENENIFQELFTYKGKGTYIKKGFLIESKSKKDVDNDSLAKVIEQAFQSTLRVNCLSSLPQNTVLYMEANRKGIAVLIPNPNGLNSHYLDIIAVAPEIQGRGLATDLLKYTIETLPNGKLFWRTKSKNPAKKLYLKIIEEYSSLGHQVGHQTVSIGSDDYAVFHIGLNHVEFMEAVRYVLNKPLNFQTTTLLN